MSKEFNFVDFETTTIKNILAESYSSIMGEEIGEGDPISDFLDFVTFIITVEAAKINEAAKQNLLKFATGEYLEAIGEMVSEVREKAIPAKTTIRYTFSRTFENIITIPKGHKTEINGIYFVTSEFSHLTPGMKTIDILCECSVAGIAGNGFKIGDIKGIVDPIPYLAAISNITESAGGLDIESDEILRNRIRENPTSKSVAGPESAYRYHVKKIQPNISDVSITTTPGTGIVHIYPLQDGGIIPGTEVIEKIKKYLTDKEIKPLTDLIDCQQPQTEQYDIDLKYYIYDDDSEDFESISSSIEDAVEQYITWQCQKLGRDINPDKLKSLVISAGAKRCEILSPEFTVLERNQVASLKMKNISYGGAESE